MSRAVSMRIKDRLFNVGEKGVKAINFGQWVYEVAYDNHSVLFLSRNETVEIKVVEDAPDDIIVAPADSVPDLKAV